MNIDPSGLYSLKSILVSIGIASFVSGGINAIAATVTGGDWRAAFVSGFSSTAISLTLIAVPPFALIPLPPNVKFAVGGFLGELLAQSLFGDLKSAESWAAILLNTGLSFTFSSFGAGRASAKRLAQAADQLDEVIEAATKSRVLSGASESIKGFFKRRDTRELKWLWDEIQPHLTGEAFVDSLKFIGSNIAGGAQTSLPSTGANAVKDFLFALERALTRIDEANRNRFN